MKPETADFCVRSKIWIEDSKGKVIFGLGRYRILEAIRRLGSMHAATAASAGTAALAAESGCKLALKIPHERIEIRGAPIVLLPGIVFVAVVPTHC